MQPPFIVIWRQVRRKHFMQMADDPVSSPSVLHRPVVAPLVRGVTDGLDPRRSTAGDWGVDTHLDVHVAAALDPFGGLVGSGPLTTDAEGHRELLE